MNKFLAVIIAGLLAALACTSCGSLSDAEKADIKDAAKDAAKAALPDAISAAKSYAAGDKS